MKKMTRNGAIAMQRIVNSSTMNDTRWINESSVANSTSIPDMTLTSPFNLQNHAAYQKWRQSKLQNYPESVQSVMVEVADINRLTDQEQQALLQCCRKTNMAIYNSKTPLHDKETLHQVCELFGLTRLDKNLYADDDGISALQVSAQQRQYEYIPYSNKSMNWHTDGYYNALHNKIGAMVLHCVVPAASGGANMLLDHEMVYLLMRDENPEYIAALMQADVMTIPANIEQGVEIRPEQTGPVFSIDSHTGNLHMRYTARTRSIAWKDQPEVYQAVQFLEKLLASDLPYIYRHRLQANQGILSNNVLHGRDSFANGGSASEQRLVYRARYYDRIAKTNFGEYSQ